MLSRVLCSLLMVASLAAAAAAGPCEPQVNLAGDGATVAAIAALLGARGVIVAAPSVARAPGCAPVEVVVEPEQQQVRVVIDRGPAPPIVRSVDRASAATVIESFARTDLTEPLLAPAPPGLRSAPVAVAVAVAPLAMVVAPRASRGIELVAAGEAWYAPDRSSWLGLTLGACVRLGPVCAAARVRAGSVADVPASWGTVERRSTELLLGIDVPLALHGLTLVPGFAGGVGQVHTRVDGVHMARETGGLRADVHAALVVPLHGHLALDLSVAADLSQVTRLESNTDMALPAEPRGMIRAGLGLRYGGL